MGSFVYSVASCRWCTANRSPPHTDRDLGEQLQETEGLLVGLRQDGDGAASFTRAAKKHTATAETPNSIALWLQAAELPTPRSGSPICQRVPAQAYDAAPMDAQNSTGDPAVIC